MAARLRKIRHGIDRLFVNLDRTGRPQAPCNYHVVQSKRKARSTQSGLFRSLPYVASTLAAALECQWLSEVYTLGG